MLAGGIQTAVSLIYPPRCLACGDWVESDFGLCGPCWRDTPFVGGLCCDGCGLPMMGEDDGFAMACDDCLAHPRPWVQGRAALLYEGTARRLILGLKHGDRTDIVAPAACWLAKATAVLAVDEPIIAPVPLHWSRYLRRRYNQSALLAQALAARLGRRCCPDLLLRSRRTPSLEGKSRAQRQAILDGSIRVNPKHGPLIQNRSVVIVDDVMTSGATLAACTMACLAAGTDVVRVAVLARVTRT